MGVWRGLVGLRTGAPATNLKLILAVCTIWGAGHARGAVGIWDGDAAVGTPGDGVSWNDANNWTSDGVVDAAPAIGDDLTFGGGTPGVIDLDGPQSANSIHFTAGFTLGTSNTNDLLSLGTGSKITVDPSVAATINAVLVGGDVTVTGGGTLTIFKRSSNNSITVDGSTLDINGTSTNTFGNFIVDAGGTVGINASNSINSTITNAGNFDVNAPLTLSNQVTNTGSFVVGAGQTVNSTWDFTQSSGVLTVDGSMTLGGQFYDAGGTINGSVNLSVTNVNQPSLIFGSNPAVGGTFNLIGAINSTQTSYSEQISGNIPPGVTVNVDPSNPSTLGIMTVLVGINYGTLNILASGLNHGVIVNTSGTLTNVGTMNINPGPTGNGLREIDSALTNTGSINANASTIVLGSITNTGTITVAQGVLFGNAYGSFTQNSGALIINGAIDLGGSSNGGGVPFIFNGGSIQGTVELGSDWGSSSVSFESNNLSGGAIFSFIGTESSTSTSYSCNISGSIPSGVTVNIDPSNSNTLGTMGASISSTNYGTLNLLASNLNHNIIITNGMYNDGIININPGPTADGGRTFNGSVTNYGVLNVNASTTMANGLTNYGSIVIADGKTLSISPGKGISFNEGSLMGQGIVSLDGGTFSTSSGTIISGTVDLFSNSGTPDVSLSGSGGVSAATFNFFGATTAGKTAYSGFMAQIPSGATVNIDPSSTTAVGTMTFNASGSTNYGTLNLLATGLNHNIVVSGLNANAGVINVQPGPTADGGRTFSAAFNNSGIMNFDASTTMSGALTNSGLITVAAGKTLSIGSANKFTQSGGNTTISGGLSVAGQLVLNGGMVEVDGSANIGSLGGNGGGELNIIGGKFSIAPQTTYLQETITLLGLTITQGGQLDLTNNALTISGYQSYSLAGFLSSYLASGYDHGAWDGAGIISSVAAGNPGTALGYSSTGFQTLIRYTWIGDANLNGIVDSTDLKAMSSTGATWSSGDFNYDGVVNADDYALFMFGAAKSGGQNISMILPEPVWGIMLVAPMGLALSRKRRRGIVN